jgi:hypothetical protein
MLKSNYDDDTKMIFDNLIDTNGFAIIAPMAKEFKVRRQTLELWLRSETTPVDVNGQERFPIEEALKIISLNHLSRSMRQKANRLYKSVIRMQADGNMPIWYEHFQQEAIRSASGFEKLLIMIYSDVRRDPAARREARHFSLEESDFQQDLRRALTYGEDYNGPVDRSEVEREMTSLIADGFRQRAGELKKKVEARREEAKKKFTVICNPNPQPVESAGAVQKGVAING